MSLTILLTQVSTAATLCEFSTHILTSPYVSTTKNSIVNLARCRVLFSIIAVTRFFYRVDGIEGGEPLLLIHGFPTASWDWEAMWETLGKRYRLYTLDMIGFGFSAKPKNYDYRIADQADLHEALLRKFQVTHYHVLAHDYGDTIAQELLARQGEPGSRPSMRTLCLTNGGLFPETHRPVLMQKLLLSPLGPLLVKFLRRDKFAQSMRHIFGKDTAPDDELIDAFWS